ncbi:RNA polymerase sigma factor [Kineococcus indalonis]|uniref:RNA polymerase sigma factor n=1 Tax=Kineococcus indalonis TaxID=2696566 RepID=UPI0014136D38|nr:RNA polymerase sigma factor [Kineococcus indalonis]NAZ87056.1 sigma-70 family RNA polymerase sigma factor [Kineococcus indalonis]
MSRTTGTPARPGGEDGRARREPPGAVSDGELWRRAVAGDADSFGVLFDRHGDAVHGYCARRTGSLDAADDLVSVVFLEAWRRRADVELVDDKALPWLYGIAGRTLQRRWRTTRRHRAALERLPRTEAEPDHADDVAARLDDRRQLAQLQAAFARLRPAEQEVLTLCVWQGLDYASAAVAAGVPVGTVRSRLSRARARLRAGTVGGNPLSTSSGVGTELS